MTLREKFQQWRDVAERHCEYADDMVDRYQSPEAEGLGGEWLKARIIAEKITLGNACVRRDTLDDVLQAMDEYPEVSPAPRRFEVEYCDPVNWDACPWVVWELFHNHRECMTNERTEAEAYSWIAAWIAEEEATDAS